MVIYYHVRFRLYTLIAEVCMETKSGIQVTTPPAQHEFTNWLQKLYWTKSVIQMVTKININCYIGKYGYKPGGF